MEARTHSTSGAVVLGEARIGPTAGEEAQTEEHTGLPAGEEVQMEEHTGSIAAEAVQMEAHTDSIAAEEIQVEGHTGSTAAEELPKEAHTPAASAPSYHPLHPRRPPQAGAPAHRPRPSIRSTYMPQAVSHFRSQTFYRSPLPFSSQKLVFFVLGSCYQRRGFGAPDTPTLYFSLVLRTPGLFSKAK